MKNESIEIYDAVLRQKKEATINKLAKEIHEIAVSKGWWEGDRNPSEIVMLVVCELAEAVEWMRKDCNTPSDHIPEFTGVEEELADAIIRILDYCGRKNFRIGEAIMAKIEFNKTRPYKHGKKF